jgi:hypothetical protein
MSCCGNCNQGRKTCETPLACELAIDVREHLQAKEDALAQLEADKSVTRLSIALSIAILLMALIVGAALS